MELFTKVDLPQAGFKIDYTKHLMFVGSCFAQNISRRFVDLKFDTLVNPFGVVYNPLSICQMFNNIASGRQYTEKDIFCDHGKWNCWDAHSSLSNRKKEECLLNLNNAVVASAGFLKKADAVFITLGTAYVYFMKQSGVPVSNCHREDSSMFERRLISVEEAAKALKNVVENLREINPDVNVVFTVSPLRHLNDGAHGNNLSKSTLHLAIVQVQSRYPDVVSYFPSYEIVMDELRDYRFYDRDMVHLSDVAEDFIFEKMGETYFCEGTFACVEQVKKFMKAVNHRVVDTGSPKNRGFAEKHIAMAENLMEQIPGLDLHKEIEQFQVYLGC
ncbi:MAG: GSCFA domain-containing protein [Fibrobacter sp.]|nr:GSCFA domain-containing protein [Fibrobacter sp.]